MIVDRGPHLLVECVTERGGVMCGEDRVGRVISLSSPPSPEDPDRGGCTPSPLPLHHPVGIFCIPPSHILG
jgi:hypothetical protein